MTLIVHICIVYLCTVCTEMSVNLVESRLYLLKKQIDQYCCSLLYVYLKFMDPAVYLKKNLLSPIKKKSYTKVFVFEKDTFFRHTLIIYKAMNFFATNLVL